MSTNGKHISLETTKEIESKFWSGVVKNDSGCWGWIGKSKARGYGAVCWKGKTFRANRVSWIVHFGLIPSHLQVLHTCDNPACCRPDHLWLGTHLQNVADREFKGRTVPPPIAHGELNHSAKMTWESVLKMRSLHTTGKFTYRELGVMFKIASDTVKSIVREWSWKPQNCPLSLSTIQSLDGESYPGTVRPPHSLQQGDRDPSNNHPMRNVVAHITPPTALTP